MGNRKLWWVIGGLLVFNSITLFILFTNSNLFEKEVATVGSEEISREQWIVKMEEEFGEETLRELVNELVIKEVAKKYEVEVSRKEIDNEWLLLKKDYKSFHSLGLSDSDWKNQIKSTLLLEKIITKDVIISESDIKSYYMQNKTLFNVPTLFKISQIVAETSEEANKLYKDIEDKSSFKLLALENSVDEYSAKQGGELGYITEQDVNISPSYFPVLKELKVGAWSSPFLVDDRYVILLLQEEIEGKQFTLKEMNDHVRRKIALEQMDTYVSVADFWNEVEVHWGY